MAPTQLPHAQQRLLAFMEALPQCPHGCHFGYVYNSPTFRVPSADDTIEDQVGEIIALYEREAPGMLRRHLAEDHQVQPIRAIERLTAADQLTWVQPTPTLPLEPLQPVAGEPLVNEWPALLAEARARRAGKRSRR